MSLIEQRRELARILQSPQFRGAPKLQRFLAFVCEQHFENRASELKEFLIATEAFGKGPDFDPAEDSIVRVQARKVRQRLEEYYEKEGRHSRLILRIPLGSYVPVFETAPAWPSPNQSYTSRFRWAILAAALTAALVPFLIYGHSLLSDRAGSGASTPAVRALGTLGGEVWKGFIESDVPTILVLSNPVIPRSPSSIAADVRQGAAATPPEAINPDEFTGMGEAVALHLVTRLFETARHRLTVKQSRFLRQDDVRRHHLILLGGRRVNPWTERLGNSLDFGSREEGIVVERPREREQPIHSTEFDAKTGKLTKDLGVIALTKDKASGHWRLFLFGIHSQGTQAAAEAVTSAAFYSKIQWPDRNPPPPGGFQVLIGVTVSDGLPLEITPLVVHTTPQ